MSQSAKSQIKHPQWLTTAGVLFSAVCLTTSSTVSAQASPQQQMQLPPSDPSSSQYNSVYLPAHGVGDTIQKGAQEKWADRWGRLPWTTMVMQALFLECLQNGKRKERPLLNARIAEVRAVIAYAYYNQCTAISTGNGTKWANAPSVEEAVETSMQQCQKGEGACRIYYSGCSLPERVQ